jgi:hypothetical protein
VILVDDHLLLRVLTGTAPPALRGEEIATTTGWWWRALSPIAVRRDIEGSHSRLVAGLGAAEAGALWAALCTVGQPGSLVTMPEVVGLAPAMAYLAREEGLNRLAAEVLAAAIDRSAAIWVRTGNEGRLAGVGDRYGVDVVVTPA